MNNYINYPNNLNDGFLLSILLDNNKSFPLLILSAVNLLLRNKNMNIAPMVDYSSKDNSLKELNNKNEKNLFE